VKGLRADYSEATQQHRAASQQALIQILLMRADPGTKPGRRAMSMAARFDQRRHRGFQCGFVSRHEPLLYYDGIPMCGFEGDFMASEHGLIAAYVLDGHGGGQEMGWEGVRRWRPADGLLWLHLDYSDPASQPGHQSGTHGGSARR
jgi:hypothetical protein